jgi:TonB-dependent SusC/RagA subfamily outer membrane receptor
MLALIASAAIAHSLTFGGSRYYVDYAEAFMRLNNPPKEENDGDIIDSILIVVNGKQLPKSMNRQLIKPRPRNGEVVNWSSISLEEALKIPVEPDKKIDNRHFNYDSELKRDLRAYFLRRDQYVSDVKVLIDAAATAIYGRIGANGAIEITTRPFLSIAPLLPDESKTRRQKFLLDVYATYHGGHGMHHYRHHSYYADRHHHYRPAPSRDHHAGMRNNWNHDRQSISRSHDHSSTRITGQRNSDHSFSNQGHNNSHSHASAPVARSSSRSMNSISRSSSSMTRSSSGNSSSRRSVSRSSSGSRSAGRI